MASSGADVDEMGRQLQAASLNDFKVMTINMGTASVKKDDVNKDEKPITPRVRRPTVKMVIVNKRPDIVFLQEIPAPISELTKLGLSQTEYGYIGGSKEAGIIWLLGSFTLSKEIKSDKKNTARDAVSHGSDLYSELSSRTCVVLLQEKSTGKNILFISWHGPYKIKDENKVKVFSALLKYLLEIRKRNCENQLTPIVIGGDFNLDLEKLSNPGDIFKDFVLCRYLGTDRREDKEIIDYFLYSGDVEIEKVEAVELNKDSPNCPFTAEELEDKDQKELYAIDHDPVVGHVFFTPMSGGQDPEE